MPFNPCLKHLERCGACGNRAKYKKKSSRLPVNKTGTINLRQLPPLNARVFSTALQKGFHAKEETKTQNEYKTQNNNKGGAKNHINLVLENRNREVLKVIISKGNNEIDKNILGLIIKQISEFYGVCQDVVAQRIYINV